MARYKGRVIVKKVDDKGKRIKGTLKNWIKNNPGKFYFDSMPEYEVWKYLKNKKIKMVSQPSLELFESTKTTEFKDNEIKTVTQRKIGYTPDYYLPDYGIYIEVKGYADDLFKLRWKLFKLKGYTGYIVYSVEECKALIKILKENENKP